MFRRSSRWPLWALLTLLLSPSCATTRSRGPTPLDRLLTAAQAQVGSRDVSAAGRRFRADCSGFVTSCFFAADVEIGAEQPEARSGTEAIWLDVRTRGRVIPRGRARIGDLAFFHNTYDRNGNGLRDDRFTHVALITARAPDGTLQITHFASGRVKVDRMHPQHPNTATDTTTGATWNSPLRAGRGKTLTGQLLYRVGRMTFAP